ncbi:hypothetical protein MMC29_004930 [Sticta canariensis]|nr:hypothetical protein [Sticta canariensis]
MAEVISGMAGALQGTLGGIVNQGQNFLDRIFPPEKRNELWAKLSRFATEKPMLASFIFSQITLSGIPIGLFVIMTITVVIFSLLGALLVGLLGALIFIVVALGFALIILLPTLFITTFAAAFIWLWGVGGYYILKWFNEKEVPGIHTPFKDGMGLDAITGDGGPEGEEKVANGGPKEDQVETSSSNGIPKKGGRGKKESTEKKGPVDGVSDKVDGVTDKVDGVTGKIPGGGKVDGVTSKVPGGNKVGDAGKAAGVDLSDPKKAADVGKVAGKTGDLKKALDTGGGGLL